MTWFIFIGDMLVMLFMVVLAAWVFYRGTDDVIDLAARIPLEDQRPGPGKSAKGGQTGDAKGKPSRGDTHA